MINELKIDLECKMYLNNKEIAATPVGLPLIIDLNFEYLENNLKKFLMNNHPKNVNAYSKGEPIIKLESHSYFNDYLEDRCYTIKKAYVPIQFYSIEGGEK